MNHPRLPDSDRFDLKNLIKTGLIISLIMGFGVGLLESLIVGFRVLSANSISPGILLQIAQFVALSVLLYAPFFLAFNLCATFLLYAINKLKPLPALSKPVNALVFLNILWISFFVVEVWMNYYTSFGKFFKLDSLLKSAGVLIGCVVLAGLSVTIYKRVLSNLKMKASKFLIVTYSAVLMLFISGSVFSSKRANASSASNRPNVLLVIVDTLRPDHLGVYGYSRNTSPNIDKMAADGIVFDRAYVPWGSSTASHASILTGQYPFTNKCWTLGDRLNDNVVTIAEILKAQGYVTAGFVTNVLVGNEHNFDQGFDTLLENHPAVGFNFRNTNPNVWQYHLTLMKAIDRVDRFLNDTKLLNRWVLEWLDEHQDENFFLWIQTSDPHCDYNPPKKFLSKFDKGYDGVINGTCDQIKRIRDGRLQVADKDIQHMIDRYDGEIAYTDALLQNVFEKLRQLNLMDNTVVAITADHGEVMDEDRSRAFGHGGTTDNVLHVPLIMHYPAKIKPGLRVEEIVETIDIVPTLMDLLEMEKPASLDGNSLLPFLNGEKVRWNSYAISFSEHSVTMRTPKWKISRQNKSGAWFLYDAASDPSETKDLSEMYPAVADSLQGELERWMLGQGPALVSMMQDHESQKKKFDQKTLQRLKTLGYIN